MRFRIVIDMRDGWRAKIRRTFKSAHTAAKALTSIRAYLRHIQNVSWSYGYKARIEPFMEEERKGRESHLGRHVSYSQ